MWQKIDPFLIGRAKQLLYYIEQEPERYYNTKYNSYRIRYKPKQVPLYWQIGTELYLPKTSFYLFNLQGLPLPEPVLNPINFSHLRSYQLESVEKCLANPNGITILPTGSGKTEIFLALAQCLGLKCLVLVPNNAVRETLILRGKKYNLDIGPYRVTSNHAITVSHPKRVANAIDKIDKPENLEDFEVLIIDECHHITDMYLTCISGLKNLKHVYGFTATLDMLNPDPIIYKNSPITARCLTYIGPILFKKTLKELKKEYPDFPGELPILLNLEVNFPCSTKSNSYFFVARSYLFTNKRLGLISNIINTLTELNRKSILILNNRKVLLKIASKLNNRWVVWSRKSITSNISTPIPINKAVETIGAMIDNDELDTILVTELGKEGIDISQLDACILFDKVGNIPVIQSIGRARAKEKIPLIVNIFDKKGLPARQAKERRDLIMKTISEQEYTKNVFDFLSNPKLPGV